MAEWQWLSDLVTEWLSVCVTESLLDSNSVTEIMSEGESMWLSVYVIESLSDWESVCLWQCDWDFV